MKPTVGRIVHFNSHAKQPHAAIITAVHEDGAALTVWPPHMPPNYQWKVQQGTEPGTWCWPPRADA